MKFWRLSLVLITAGALALPAPAGILFGKKNKPNPAERVPELIVIVKTDKDESKRVAAAEELRQYDPAAQPDVVPVLIDVLMNDAKPAVRVEAAESLGKIRPVSQEAGWALEQAKEKDTSWHVRSKARYALLGYYLAGYHSDPKMKEATIINPKDQPAEKVKVIVPPPGAPPMTGNKGTPDKVIVTPAPTTMRPVTTPSRPISGETVPPPLADTAPKPAPVPSLRPQPLPLGPAKVEPSPLPPIPAPPGDGGPTLNGPGE